MVELNLQYLNSTMQSDIRRSTIAKEQEYQLSNLGWKDGNHVASVNVLQRTYITYKLCLFMHHIHIGQAPQHLSDCVSTASEAGGRYRLRSTGSAAYVLPRTRTRFGERGFFYSGPAAWNTLPSDLHYITDTSTL